MAASSASANFSESSPQRESFFEAHNVLYYVVINGLIAVTVFFSLVLFNGFLRQYLQYPQTSTSDTCKSPNCIRCRSSYLKSYRLIDRLDEFITKKSIKPESADRLFESLLHGIRNSDCVRQRPTTFGMIGLSSKPWHENLYLSELKQLIDNIPDIRKEIIKISEDLSCGWVQNTCPTGRWYVLHLYNQGKKVQQNCSRCPLTSELVQGVSPFMKECAFGNAVVSLVKPGTHITQHYGPTNCRLRCHIPLVIPKHCTITVDLEQRRWQDSHVMIFDDSYLHEVRHSGSQGNRIVLILDLWHPEITTIEMEAINFVFSNVELSR